MAQWNALMSIKAVTGKLPVNIVFVAEGDEERMDIGVRKFVKDHPDFFKNAEALIGEAGQQSPSGGGERRRRIGRLRLLRADDERQVVGPRPGAVRHPRRQQARGRQPGVAPHQDAGVARVRRRQHGAHRRLLRRHGAAVGVRDGSSSKKAAAKMDMKVAAENLGVARFISDDPLHDAEDGALRHLDQPGRHLGRQHVCGRRRRDPAEQDHVEAQHPLRAEDERPRDRASGCASSSIATATRTSR